MRWMAMCAAIPAAMTMAQEQQPEQMQDAQAHVNVQESPERKEMPGLAEVETRGEGDQHVVLIPGLASDWTIWEPFMERNKDRFTMHAVTLPGFGGTAAPATPNDNSGTPWLDNAVKGVADLIKNSDGVQKAMVIGHSLGGLVAYRLADEHPDLVSGVVAVDALPALPLNGQQLSEAQRVQVVEAAAPQVLGMGEQAWQQQIEQGSASQFGDAETFEKYKPMLLETKPDVGARYLLELLKSDLSDDLREVKTPVVIVAAINEGYAQAVGGLEGYKQIWQQQTQNAESVEVDWAEGSTGFVMFDKPDWFDKRVAAFAESVEQGGES